MEFIYCNNNKEVHRHSVKIQLKLGQLRKPGKDDLQAIVAVHEAGHAVLCIAGLKIIPDCICSTTADIDSAGFISVTNNKRKYLSKDMIIPKIAECLAGLAAEKLVFGEQYITRGSQDDLDTATALAARSVKDYGFGQLKALANVASFHTKNEWHDTEGEINREVRALLEQGWALAEEVLTKEKNLLLQLSDYLSEERVIKREQIIEMVRQYGTQAIQDVDFDNETNYQYYRAKLKEQVQSLTNHPPVSLVVSEPASFSLNKKM
jgi:ATP-dependent Zn protease